MKMTRPDFMDHTYRNIDIYVIDLDPEQFQGLVGLKNSSTEEDVLLPFWRLEQITDESHRSVEFQIKACIDASHEEKENQHTSCYLLYRGDELDMCMTGSFFDLLMFSSYEKLELD